MIEKELLLSDKIYFSANLLFLSAADIWCDSSACETSGRALKNLSLTIHIDQWGAQLKAYTAADGDILNNYAQKTAN